MIFIRKHCQDDFFGQIGSVFSLRINVFCGIIVLSLTKLNRQGDFDNCDEKEKSK